MLPCSCPAPGTQCGRFCTYLLISLSVYADAGFNSCPYCWKTCSAVSADACMGLKHRRTAGTASQDIQPLFDRSESGLIPTAEIQRRLQSVPAADAAEAEAAACSDFKAAALPRRLSTQTGQYDVAGVAAAICRHEHVLAWCDLQGPENFSYYDALVERCMMVLGGRGLAIFFVDIACRYAGWFEK